ncbi:MAG: hypothetical protein ABIR54_07120 [Burkholderiaceae bacterium]
MSIAVMTDVWRRSQHSGSHLLMMLALADFSDDKGCSYPGVAALAGKCRMKVRNAQTILAALRDSKELEIRMNAGPYGCNRYRIVLTALGGVQELAGCKPLQGASECTMQPDARTPASPCAKPLQALAPEPSLNRQETSDRGESSSGQKSKAKTPDCPHAELLAIFAEKVPELPKPTTALWAGRGATAMQDRWRWVLTATDDAGKRYASTPDEALKFFGKFFGYVGRSDFLTGRNGKWRRCNLRWLLKPENFAKVMEGDYENDEPASSAMDGAI